VPSPAHAACRKLLFQWPVCRLKRIGVIMPVATARNGSQSARGSTRVKGAKIVCIVVTVIWVEPLLRQLGSFHDSADGVLAEANPPADHAVAQACFGQLNDPWGFAIRRSLSWLATEPFAASLGNGDPRLNAVAN